MLDRMEDILLFASVKFDTVKVWNERTKLTKFLQDSRLKSQVPTFVVVGCLLLV